MNNEPVSVVFTASKSWFSKAIRWFTKSRVSHVFIEFPVWGQDCAVEATVGGTRLVLASKARHDVVKEYRFKDGVEKRTLIHMMQHLGTPYDYTGVLFIAWMKIAWSWLKMKARAASWSSKALKCSELVFMFLYEAGVHVQSEKELVSPEDILKTCESRTDTFCAVDGSGTEIS